MIKDIQIHNFRGIKDVQIEDFGIFNLFVGENSCGKTSILESIYMCYSLERSGSVIRVQNFRKAIVLPTNLSSIFCNFDFIEPIEFSSHYDSKKVNVKIQLKSANEIISQEKFKQTYLTEQNLNGLEFSIEDGENKIVSSFTILANGSFQVNDETNGITYNNFPFLVFFLSSDNGQWGLQSFIETVKREKETENLIKHLKIFDPRVLGIETQGDRILLDLQGMSKLIDINFLGEGFKKYLAIIALIIFARRCYSRFCICIDEIENGLHHSSIKKLLISILSLAEDIDCQFFFATHSIEFLDIAREVLGLKSKIFKVVSTKKGVKVYTYSQEGDPYYTMDRIDPRGSK